MLRIGIIGADNFHAKQFSAIANTAERAQARQQHLSVTAVYDPDPAAAQALAAQYRIGFVADDPAQLSRHADAVMITTRDGGTHLDDALPFLRQGMPVWVDKPLALTPADAQALCDTAAAHGALLAGGSNCKHLSSVRALANTAQTLREKGQLLSGAFNFPGCLDSPYHGLYFYGSHSVEILTAIFGTDVRSVRCTQIGPAAAALFDCGGIGVQVNLTDCWDYACTLYTPQKLLHRRIPLTGLYQNGLKAFYQMVIGRRPAPSPHSLVQPVRLLAAMVDSIKAGGKEIVL